MNTKFFLIEKLSVINHTMLTIGDISNFNNPYFFKLNFLFGY